jgi:light-regulated signal transduction histidine kinase (bacteriophytochrome)
MARPPETEQTSEDAVRGGTLADELSLFCARAGHDLLGPLNQSAALLALFVRRYRSQLDAEADVLLEYLGNSAERMDTLLGAVRRYMDIACEPLSRRTTDLEAALSSALAILEPAVKANDAAITSDPLPNAECDTKKITILLEILVGNAIKFRRPDEAPRIHISTGREEDKTLITVADNGIGIDPEQAEEVLLPFRRLNGREYPGAGLGLATATLIARLHGGGIRVLSSPAGGTAVTVIF